MLMTHHSDSLSPPQSLHAALVISDSCIFSLKHFLASRVLWVLIWGLQKCPREQLSANRLEVGGSVPAPSHLMGQFRGAAPVQRCPQRQPTLYWLSPSPVSLLYSFLTLLRITSRCTGRP